MSDQKPEMVKNEMYVKNVWLRVLIALGIGLVMGAIVANIYPFLIILGMFHYNAPASGVSMFGYTIALMTKHHWLFWSLGIWNAVIIAMFVGSAILSMSSEYEEKPLTRATNVSGKPVVRSTPVRIQPRGNLFIAFPYSLEKDEALRRVRELLQSVRREHAETISALDERWTGDTNIFRLTAQGYTVQGTLSVHPGQVFIDADIPFPASLAKGRIKDLIRQQMQLCLV